MSISSLKTIQQNFLHELQDASLGKKTSLPFIVHKLSSSPIVGKGEIFQALVIGGSMCKNALLKKEEGEIKILKKTEKPQPPFITKDDFLQFIEREAADNVRIMALNFAYPLSPFFENGILDGVLQFGTKENKFIGLVGKKVGKEIKKYVFRKSNKRIAISVANDTICLLLSGLTKYSWEYLAGGVVGTGLNFAFFINKHRPVNVESANFNKFVLSEETKHIEDVASSAPGKALFEKETAGAYLYRHFNLIIKSKKINFSVIRSTEELDSISRKNLPQVSEIAQNLIKRSAQLVACQIAGITEFKKVRHSGEERSDDSRIKDGFWTSQNDEGDESMVFNMEGSLFWKGNNYKETVQNTVKQLVPEYKVKFVEIENSAILGAAKLVC